jgi:hypothetical protein
VKLQITIIIIIIIIPKKNPQTPFPIHNSCKPTTHIDCGLLVGAGIQQQPHAVSATMACSMNQRRPSELCFLCAAAVRRRKVTRAHRDTNAHPQIPTRKYANDDDVISERYAKRKTEKHQYKDEE